MTSFTPGPALVGGLLIGLAAVLLLLFDGRLAGISGIAGGLVDSTTRGDRAWRVAFIAGLVLGAGLSVASGLVGPGSRSGLGPAGLVVAGLLVGYGTSLAKGCTSGHGVCGLARLSVRSFVAVAVFLVTAIVTVTLQRHVWTVA